MITRLFAVGHRVLVAWVDLMRRLPGVVLLAAVLLTLGAGHYVATHFEISTDTSDMLDKDLPFRQLSRALDAAFPQFTDNIVIVVDGDTADLADAGARALADRLRARPELFGDVFDPGGLPFFRRHALLYMDLEDLEDFSGRLARAQPFLATLNEDPSLRGLVEVLLLALGENANAEERAAVAPVLDQMAAVAEAQAAGRFATLSWQEVMRGDRDPGDRRRILLIQPRLDFATLHPGRRAMDAIRAAAAALSLDPAHGVRVRLTGSAALSQEELDSVEEGIGTANVASLLLVAGLLVIGLRSARLVIAVLTTLLMGLLWTAALALIMVGQFNLISVAFAVLFIGLGVDFGIHFSLRYREGRERGQPHDGAIRWAAGSVGGPLVLSAIGAGVGFFSFLPTPYLGFGELGLIAGVGMFVALFSALTVLPALLTLMPLSERVLGAPANDRAMAAPLLVRVIGTHARTVTVVAAVLAVVASAALPSARFDFDPLRLRDPKTESVSTFNDLMNTPGSGAYSITVLAADLDQAAALARSLEALPTVGEVSTLRDYVPGNQDDKLALIEDMALLLTPMFVTDRLPPPTTAQRHAALERLDRALAEHPEPAAVRLRAALPGIDRSSEAALAELERRLLGLLEPQVTDLAIALTAKPVTLGDLPSAVRERMVAADGRAKVTVTPRENIAADRAAMHRFVEDVRRVTPLATGAPVTIYESGQAVVASFQFATIATVLILLAMMAVLMQSVRDVLLAFAPLVLAALLTNAVAVLIDLPFNFANIIALPLLFGTGIANGIQFVSRERLERDPLRLLQTSTPRAVTFSALTTVASFGSLALSTHPGTASMGMLLGIAIGMTLFCTMFVLPALMATLPARRSDAP